MNIIQAYVGVLLFIAGLMISAGVAIVRRFQQNENEIADLKTRLAVAESQLGPINQKLEEIGGTLSRVDRLLTGLEGVLKGKGVIL